MYLVIWTCSKAAYNVTFLEQKKELILVKIIIIIVIIIIIIIIIIIKFNIKKIKANHKQTGDELISRNLLYSGLV